MPDPSPRHPEPLFATTRWTLVMEAVRTTSAGSRAALEAICRTYWYPLYAYARRCGLAAPDSQDITQEFFRLLLEKRWLQDVDREKGRLRSFLVAAMKHFMAKEWRRASALKRGGGQGTVPIDAMTAESRYSTGAGTELIADELFDRQWALTLLDVTLKRLEQEYAAAGRARQFAALKHGLALDHEALNYQEIATRLGFTEGAVHVAMHRLRKRFRAVYREEIAHTLPAGADPDDEMRHLARALARS